MSDILTPAQIEAFFDRNGVSCANCGACIVAKGGTLGEHHGLTAAGDRGLDQICGYCAGLELDDQRATVERLEARLRQNNEGYCSYCGNGEPKADCICGGVGTLQAQLKGYVGEHVKRVGEIDKLTRERDAALEQVRDLKEQLEEYDAELAALSQLTGEAQPRHFQAQVGGWLLKCFGQAIANDGVERNFRFLEEGLELVQAFGCTREECLKLVEYVYSRPIGDPSQEVGGVMITLAALCWARGIEMEEAASIELARINNPATIEKIRAKQAAKTLRSGATRDSLPGEPAESREKS